MRFLGSIITEQAPAAQKKESTDLKAGRSDAKRSLLEESTLSNLWIRYIAQKAVCRILTASKTILRSRLSRVVENITAEQLWDINMGIKNLEQENSIVYSPSTFQSTHIQKNHAAQLRTLFLKSQPNQGPTKRRNCSIFCTNVVPKPLKKAYEGTEQLLQSPKIARVAILLQFLEICKKSK